METELNKREARLVFWLGLAIGAGLISALAFFTLLLYMLYGGNAVLKLG